MGTKKVVTKDRDKNGSANGFDYCGCLTYPRGVVNENGHEKGVWLRVMIKMGMLTDLVIVSRL